jgi:energy-coupling factor transporter ATP-binding protein EcfA2
MPNHFTAIKFRNYKAFKSYSVNLAEFNILVGANNAGKSTVIGAFRILAEGLKRARSRNAEYNDSALIRGYCYSVNLAGLPVSTENVFTNYDESEPAIVEFKLSNGNALRLIFPEREVCYLVCDTAGKSVKTPAEFKRAFDVTVSFVPILGPVEHEEQLNTDETARRALLTHRASRNFRNIWYHIPDGFEAFRRLVQETWPGMDIQPPEVRRDAEAAKLDMFCPEERVPRELYWAGFGFQVWCQMLTFISKAPTDSLLIIDEPDIYLHSDLQRQLVGLLRDRAGDVIIATHSTEILAEAESGEIVVLNKKGHAAHRVKNPTQLQSLFGALGSNLNPTLTQLAKTKRALFVEGDDFSLLAAFARKLGHSALANRTGFAVIPAKGFNPSRVSDFSDGMEATLSVKISRGVVFDRDYRSIGAVRSLTEELSKNANFVWIHERKELENFLLVPQALDRAVRSRIQVKKDRGGKPKDFKADIHDLLDSVTAEMKSDVFGQYNAAGVRSLCEINKGMDHATASSIVHKEVEEKWGALESRLMLVPGKALLARINDVLQQEHGISITTNSIVASMRVDEIPDEMRRLVAGLAKFAIT